MSSDDSCKVSDSKSESDDDCNSGSDASNFMHSVSIKGNNFYHNKLI